jgi:sulfoxide reductase heme-binding subunit YedZ
VIIAAGGNALWYSTRATGAVSLVLLTISFLMGIPTLLDTATERLPRIVVQLLHRNVSLLVLIFLALHIATAVADGFVTIRWLDAVVPFGGAYRPLWLGLGAVAFDLLLAVIITSLVRVRIGYQTWRYVHLTTYAIWPIAFVHGLGTGSDTRYPWMWWVCGACAVTVLVAVTWRLVAQPPATPSTRNIAITLVVVLPLLIGAWLVRGPLQPGWGRTHRVLVSDQNTGP